MDPRVIQRPQPTVCQSTAKGIRLALGNSCLNLLGQASTQTSTTRSRKTGVRPQLGRAFESPSGGRAAKAQRGPQVDHARCGFSWRCRQIEGLTERRPYLFGVFTAVGCTAIRVRRVTRVILTRAVRSVIVECSEECLGAPTVVSGVGVSNG